MFFASVLLAALPPLISPLTEYEPNLQDRCWMWGHDSGMYDKPGDPFNIPPSEKVSMADACAYMGVSNVSVVIWYLPDEEYCAQFRNLKRVAWVVDNGDLKQYRGKDILAKHLEFAFRKFETMPNLMGVEFDDYFFQPQPPPVRETLEDGSVVDVVPGPRTLKEIRRTMKRLHAYRRPIDARIIVYERDLGSEAIRPVVNEFDTVMFWTWTGANVAQLRENFARYRRLVPKKRTLLGIYMWDFGGKKPIGVETMRMQLDFALEKFRCGEIDGVIFHCTPLVNKNLPEVEMCRRWIAEHGQERIGKRDPVRESIEQDVYESARVNRLLQSSGESVSLADYEGLTTARDGKRYWDKALSTALKERSAVRIPSGEHWFADVIRLDSNSRIEAEGRSVMRFDIDPSLPMVQNAPGATNLLLSGGVWIGPEKASVAFRFQEGERITVSELVLSNAVDFAVRAGGVAHLVMDGIRMPQGGFSGICFDGGVRTALLRNMERLGGVVAYPVKSAEGHGPPVRFEDVVFDNLKFNLTRPLPNLAEMKDVSLAKGCFSAFEFGVDADRILLRDVLVRFHKDKCPLSGVMQVCPGAFNREDEPVVRNVRIENLMIRGWAPDGYVNVLKGRIEGGLNAVTPRRHGNLVHDIRCPLPIEERHPELEGNDYDWFERHESRKKLARTTDPQIVFVGDSITHGWEANDMRGNVRANFTRWFGRYGALNLGFGWDRIQNVLWRLEHGEMDGIHPKVVVVHIGTNNTSPGYVCPMTPNAPEDIARGILSVCRKVRELAPAAHIVLMKVFPRGATAGNPDQLKVDAVNAELDRRLADFKDGRITVLDLHDRLVDATGGVPLDLTCDHLHPNVKGYGLWAEALKPIVTAECVDRSAKPQTFCNPLPLPELPKSVYINCGGKGLPHRQVSDPNLIRDQGRWYLYPSAGFVYESDDDGGTWVRHDNSEKVGGKLEGHGPGAVRHRGRFYYIPRTDGVLYDAECAEGPFRKLGKIDLPADVPGPADPMLFSDDDGRLYFYWGCTARGGIWGCELDTEDPTRVISRPVELISFDPVGQPWECAANNPQNGWLEGAWMVKLNGRYCLTFAAGGAENETYAMGAYWSDRPLADFKPQRRNPFFISPKGLVTGTGHGSVVQDERGQLWVSYCIRVGSRHWFERLVGMDRLRLDANGEIEPSSASSEPQFLPSSGTGAAGWQRIPVQTQSAGAADESLQTFTWLLDLPGKIDYAFVRPQVVRSFRICWREDGYDPDNGVPSGPFRYRLVLRDADGRETVAFDASANAEDRLVDYREIVPTEAVAARLELLEAPHGIKAGVSDFALFGNDL